MTTKLDKALKREIEIGGRPYIVTIMPDGLKVTGKGKRKGHELQWVDLVSGEAALAVALNASLQRVGADARSAGASAPAEVASPAVKRPARSGAGRKSAARPATKKRKKR